jgi:hypothetical protein
LQHFVTSKLFKVNFTIFFAKNKNEEIQFFRGEPYFFKKKYSFARWRTCYGVTVTKPLAKDRHQALTKTMGIEAFDYSQSESVQGRALDCS